jgi:hypothetical protein
MKIDFQDEDNDKVVCRFATGVAECGGICGALESAGATIDEERCILEWLSPAEGMHAAAVMIEDFDAEDNLLSSVPLQFLIEVFPLEGPCLTPTVQPRDVCFIIQPGATFTQDIVATPVDDSNAAEVSTITDIVITSKPTLMTVGDLVEDSVTNEAKKTATWTPTVAEYGSHQFCYTAIDDNGRESPACVTLKAGVSEELPVIEDFSPKDDALLLNDPQELTITFTERVAIPSLDTKSIRVHEFDGDEEIEVIDVTESSSQVTLLDGEKSATIKITKTLFPDRRHYVLVDDGAFTALEDCAGLQSPVSGISDKNTWTFIAEGGPGKCGFTDDCHEKAVCTDIFGDPLVDFRCECMPGYTGDGKTCEDTDECDLVNPTHDCDAMADCDNTPSGSFTCTCKEGYAGDGKTSCEDINECDPANPTHNCLDMADCDDECDLTNPTHDCHAMATCTNTPSGSFTCTCKEGYAGDGKTSCEDIDECDLTNPTHDCHAMATCTNTPSGSFTCTCKEGYAGDGKTSCEDINECDPANPTHNCLDMADCDNTPSGSFTCTCKEGYAGDGKTSCEDIDECDLTNPTHDCHAMATCTNTPSGSFTCTCKEGYAGDGKTSCEDIDECDLTNPTHDCHAMATCTNTPSGSFTCTCKEGYAGDGKTSCEDINECDPANPTHNCLDMADCDNTPSGSFTCTCKEGYAGDGTTICEDIDECKEGLHDCPADRVCINTEGSFQCGCDVGLFFDGVSCVDNCTAGWPVVRDRYIANDTDWQDLSENCPGANFDDPSVMDDEPPIKQWQMLLEQFLKDYAGWLDIIRNLISDVPRLPDIDPNASPEEVWDILYEVHKQAQEAWQEQVGDPNGITFPDPFADCEDDRRSKWLMSAATTEESVDKYREVFGDRCDA